MDLIALENIINKIEKKYRPLIKEGNYKIEFIQAQNSQTMIFLKILREVSNELSQYKISTDVSRVKMEELKNKIKELKKNIISERIDYLYFSSQQLVGDTQCTLRKYSLCN